MSGTAAPSGQYGTSNVQLDAPSGFDAYGGKGRDFDANGQPIRGSSSAEQETDRYRAMAAAAGGRMAPGINYSQGNDYANMGLGARQSQLNALGMIRNQAIGNGPSAAALGMSQANNQTAANQLSALGGMHAGNNALANQQVVGQGAGALANNMAQGGAARSQELAGAQNALFGGYQNMRGQDQQGMGMQDARTQYLAQAALRQNAMNQGQQLGLEGLGQGAQISQLHADEEVNALKDQKQAQQRQLDLRSDQNKQGVVDKLIGGAAGAISGIGGGIAKIFG